MTEHPPSTLLEVPELKVVILDRTGVERAFTELAFETSVLEVLVKGGTTERAQAPAPNLRTARDVLLGEEATGVQIHYGHGGVEWWATFMRTREGVRFVRVRQKGPE